MIKFYLSTVVIWFVIIMANHILFRKEFKKAQKKIKKATNDNSKTYGNIRTTLMYLLISFIPIYRFIELVTYYTMIANPNKMIEIIKKREEEYND